VYEVLILAVLQLQEQSQQAEKFQQVARVALVAQAEQVGVLFCFLASLVAPFPLADRSNFP
jgi:hypothetical protein